uniref:Solute carrier family 6 member 17 n=1 Tax=Oncorhynchus kisutch TaxID=8019 RepID=A0A8C7HAI9_ONCKI
MLIQCFLPLACFGGVITFSSYNKIDNNCHFAMLVSFINFFTSILATLVVFAVLGFKANLMNEKCVIVNAEKIIGCLNSNVLSHDLILPHVNFSQLSTVDYTEIYGVIKTVKEGSFAKLGLDPCVLEDELNKSVQGTGLAFIAFTEAMTHFPASPFWSVMFFFMLINLGLGSMIGTMTGITTPLFTVCCCIIAFICGLLLVQRSGNYFVIMFDDYSGGLLLTVVVILENVSVAWIYGFMQDLEDMLGFRPHAFYFYMWKYVSPCCLIVLIMATVIEMAISPPGYNAWVEELLSVSYRKSMMKDISNLEEVDETHFILGKNPRETPLPKPLSQVNLVPPGTKPLENSNSSSANSCYRTGYQNTIIPITPTTTVTPTVPESDS